MEKKNNLDPQYNKLLEDILTNGVKKQTRNGETLSVFGRQIRHDMSEGFPLLTGKKMFFKGIVTELLWFLRGDTNIKYLVDNDCHIWDGDVYKNYLNEYAIFKQIIGDDIEKEIECIDTHSSGRPYTQEELIDKIKTDDTFFKFGYLGPIYGKQWRNWNENDVLKWRNLKSKKEIDQIQNLINDLKTNPDSRRLMVNAWNVGELDQMVLPPCHFSFQCYSHEKEGKRYLSLAWNQRSVDCGLGLPFNIASYGLLLEILAKEVGMIPDQLIGNLGDCHLYNDHIEPIKEQLLREPFPLPTFDCPAMDEIPHNTFDELVNRLLPCDFYMDDYQSHPTIKLPLSN
jgi:thymidylate synthase